MPVEEVVSMDRIYKQGQNWRAWPDKCQQSMDASSEDNTGQNTDKGH